MSFEKKILDNGLRLILVPSRESLSLNVLVLVEAGSKYETKEINGISHFLEHMCFKGTTRRPGASLISAELDGLGAQYNAFTSQEYTGYYASCLPDKLPEIVDILADMYKDPLFVEGEIEKEKGVICEEINMYEDLPQVSVGEALSALVYGDQPAGWSIGGKKEIVRSFTRQDFVEYRRKNYLSPATAIVVAGNFNPAEAERLIKEKFGDLPTGDKQDKLPVKEEQVAPMSRFKAKKLDQAHLAFGFRSIDAFSKDESAVIVLAHALGGSMSSRLFQKLRDELGMAYYVRAGQDSLSDHGLFTVKAGVAVDRQREAVQAILDECRRFKEESLSPEELQKVKNSLLGDLLLDLETPASLGGFYGHQEILRKKLETPQELAEKIKAVTADGVRNLAEKIFVADKLNLAVVGPAMDEQKIVEILTI